MSTNRLIETALRYLLAALCCGACTKDVAFRDKETDPVLVVNSIVTAGEAVCFSVSKSVFFLEDVTNTSAPEGLEASLFVNGVEITGLTVEDDTVGQVYGNDYYDSYSGIPVIHKLFRSAYVAKEGDEVRIKVSAPGFAPVEGSCTLPTFQTQFEIQHSLVSTDIDTSYAGDSTYWVSAEIAVKIQLTDLHPGSRDYYLLQLHPSSSVIREGSYEHGDYKPTLYWNLNAYSNDPVFQQMRSPLETELDGESALPDHAIFTDLLFDGKSHTLNITLKFLGLLADTMNNVDFDVEIRQLDRNLYQYYNTCDGNNGWLDEIGYFFREPVQTFSNISQGYGIVGASSRKSGHVRFKAF
ncbi:MAG: DUF4249 domain-containing protein [Bacteroidales bacterium]|nr:DUF4249 domain-containing protein [Bacteroidales bacterium]